MDLFSLSTQEASEATKEANERFVQSSPMDWDYLGDVNDAKKGLITCPEPLVIQDDNGKIIQDNRWYKANMSQGAKCLDTVNPSLWRHGTLNTEAGIFKVTDGVYQVRGYDISNMTVVEGETGYILMDVLMKNSAAKAALDLVFQQLGQKPVHAVIIGHSHSDHYGGIGGVFEKLGTDRIPVLAPKGMEQAALNENIIAGGAMQKRAETQFGFTLPVSAKGAVDGGLGKRGPSGIGSFAMATDHICKTGETRVYDGVEFVFQMAPETEAPATMEVYIPSKKLLWVGELANQTNHNLCPIRGALTRDALVWSNFIDELIYLFPEAEIAAGSHFWPTWGRENVVKLLEVQRDLYKFTHDQTMHLANLGYTGSEIANRIKLPSCLGKYWCSRDYYGNLKFNARAVYTRYMGWYEGNPIYLNPLSRREQAEKMIPLLGGADKAIEAAVKAFDSGEYQWVLQLLDLVIALDQGNMKARAIMAAASEQLGYQQETATWRNAYLVAAKELREGNQNGAVKKTLETYMRMDMESLLRFVAVKYDGTGAENFSIKIDWDVTDLNKHYYIDVSNCVVHHRDVNVVGDITVCVSSDKAGLIKFLVLNEDAAGLLERGELRVQGDKNSLITFQYMLAEFKSDFNLVLR